MAYDNYARAIMPENLDSMPDYATALKIYNARKPYIKGKYKGERPLGSNRVHCRSRIVMDDNGNIRVKHWQTDIIVYDPDGGITLNTGGWSSISTAQIMQELLGVDKICRVNCKVYYRHNNEFNYLAGGLYIEPDGNPLHKNNEYVYKPKPEAMKEYRKKYAFFLEYAKQVLTMSSDFQVGTDPKTFATPKFEGETLKEWYMAPLLNTSARHDLRARDRARDSLFGYLDSLSTKAEEDRLLPMYELIAPITYMMSGDQYRSFSGSIQWACNYTQFKRGFENLIKYQFGSYIFEFELASKKSPVRDVNAKYMRTY
jgi:hypothetical protein